MKRFTTAIILASFLSINTAMAAQYDYNQYNQPASYGNFGVQQQQYQPQQYQPQTQQYQQPQYKQTYSPLQGHVVIVPAGTVIQSTVNTTYSTANLTVGDGFSMVLNQPFYYQNQMIAPQGSMVNGTVVIAEKAGRTGKNGKLKIAFNNIMLPNGQMIPISGKIATQDSTGILTGGTTMGRVGDYAKDAAIGAGIGALAGTVLGPLSGGSVGRGAIYGTALGGGLGLGKALIDKGTDVIIQPGDAVDLILEQPMSINPSAQQYY